MTASDSRLVYLLTTGEENALQFHAAFLDYDKAVLHKNNLQAIVHERSDGTRYTIRYDIVDILIEDGFPSDYSDTLHIVFQRNSANSYVPVSVHDYRHLASDECLRLQRELPSGRFYADSFEVNHISRPPFEEPAANENAPGATRSGGQA